MRMFSLQNRDLINEINNGNIEPTDVVDAVAYAERAQLKIVFEGMENNKFDEVIIFFWDYDEKKALYVRKTKLTDGCLVWKDDASLRMQMKYMEIDSVRFAIAIKAGNEYSCGYIRNKVAQSEAVKPEDRLICKLYSKDKEAFIAYWTEGGILSLKNRSEKAFDDEYYRAELSGAKWENNTFIGYVEVPLMEGELNVIMQSMTTGEKCEWADIKVTKEGFTGIKNVYRMTINILDLTCKFDDAYQFNCIVDGHEFKIVVDEFALENEKIHTITCDEITCNILAVREKNGMFSLQLAEKIYPVMLSVVTAVYNTAPFLAEMINSVLMQTTGKVDEYIIGNETKDYTRRKYQQLFELILVDDGSTDGSAEILDDYARMSDVIRIIHKENGGVSSARNAGIDVARGKYINFADSDDKFSDNFISECLMFFENHYDDISMVTTPMKFFDAAKGDHWTNYKFTKSNTIIDLENEPTAINLFVCSSFFKSADAKKVEFDCELINGEDIRYIYQILKLSGWKIGGVVSADYQYRRRSTGEPSAIDCSANDTRTYTDYIKNVLKKVIIDYSDEKKRIPKFVQYLVMGNLQWKYKVNDAGNLGKKLLGEKGFSEYKKAAGELLEYIDDDVILSMKKIYSEHMYYLLKLKYKCMPIMKYEKNDMWYLFGDSMIPTPVSRMYVQFDFLNINKDVLVLEGYYISFEPKIDFIIKINDLPVVYQELDRKEINKFSMDDIVLYGHQFKIKYDLEHCETDYIIAFYEKVDGIEIKKTRYIFSKNMPLSEKYSKSYYMNDGWAIRFENLSFHVYDLHMCDRYIPFEEEYCRSIKSIEKNEFDEMLLLRQEALNILAHKEKKIFLISDRSNAAGDNGEAFFRYLSLKKLPDIDFYFVLERDSADYERMCSIGKVIIKGSKLHYVMQLSADYIISSSGDEYIFNPWASERKKFEIVKDLLERSKFIFLQHGITINDISGWLNRYNKNITGFVCAAKQEAQSILDYNFYYSSDNVWLTGFPRHDRLYHAEKRQIVIMPTWRRNLTVIGDENNMLKEGFTESEYFKFYNSLINNDYLLRMAKKYNYKICFMPHPGVKRHGMKYFKKNEEVEFFDFDMPYRDVFANANLVITDYSSASLDFSLLEKPVIYCQFDKAEFYENHLYKPGYFDYEKDGFGEVVYDLKSLVELVIQYIQNECKMHEPYITRARSFFEKNDGLACERVLKKILEIDAK